jgi:hypothetical protein
VDTEKQLGSHDPLEGHTKVPPQKLSSSTARGKRLYRSSRQGHKPPERIQRLVEGFQEPVESRRSSVSTGGSDATEEGSTSD